MRPLVGRSVYCRVCEAQHMFSRCWRRMAPMRQCPCCGFIVENLGAVYSLAQPICPKCDEPFEYPNFDYGFCDACGSKYEIMEGTKPGLMPNKAQRVEMNKHGRGRTHRP